MTPRLLLSLLPALLTTLVLHATPASAQFGLTDVNCTGNVKQTWTPGIKVLPTSARHTTLATYTVCSSAEPTILGGSITTDGLTYASCLAGGDTAQSTVQWSDGTFSTFTMFGVGSYPVAGLQVSASLGTVIAGRFIGDLVVLTHSYASTQFSGCLTPLGLTQLSGTSTLVFTKVQQ
ncbi:hypothetical protein LXT21_27230 [Myxococcus sp. K38C18041901]|uniref:hypothetical protein n=1 Tax=Myxococcus guangdongensis TaxID=2906760 RepID=UPI0020A806BD|nr:hypothetical protein [Myxococcus guangdongensis]MCP3062490.1 hypothetical protein [Myxococcus guangdongensis]